MVAAVWQVLLELAPWLLLGTAIAALLHAWLPANLVRRHLDGRLGVLKAVVLGVPLPLCSCGVIPAAVSLREDGASRGSALGFMISTPQTGVDSILVSASFLGWPFALFKVVAALVMGLVGGGLADAIPDEQHAVSRDVADGRPGLRAGVLHGVEVLRSIWVWLVFGVLASAAITVFMPTEAMGWISSLGNVGASLAALAIAAPLYVCATASVPIAAALVAGGLPGSAALVFLMAGPATNVATMGAVLRTFGRRSLVVYLLVVIVGSLGLGLAFDAVYALEVAPMSAHAMDHSEPWRVAATIGLLGLLAFFAAESLMAQLRRARARLAARNAARETALELKGLTCGGCVRKLESALRELDGVDEVLITTSDARVLGIVSRDEITSVIRATGFDVV